MTSSDFIRQTEEYRGTSYVTHEYTDGTTGRSFSVRELMGPTDLEVVTGRAAPGFTIRYFAEEFKPNGRLVCHGEIGEETKFIDVPEGEWSKATKTPSKASMVIKKYLALNPGYSPISFGGGLGIRSIFYSDLDECARAITNAIDADMWLQCSEPIKCVTVAERTEITLEANSLLKSFPGAEQITAAIHDVASALAPSERAEVSEHAGGIRIDVTDSEKPYPASCRLLLIFKPTGQAVERPGYYRGHFGPLAERIAGRVLPNYDGPAGVACGLPAQGQSFNCPVRPDCVADIEVLHKMEGTANKVYLHATVSGKSFFAWGKFSGGKLQTKRASRSGYEQLSKKRDRGYDRISPESVPEIWARVLEAANGLA